MRCGALCVLNYHRIYTCEVTRTQYVTLWNAIKKDFYMMGTGVLFLYNSYFFEFTQVTVSRATFRRVPGNSDVTLDVILLSMFRVLGTCNVYPVEEEASVCFIQPWFIQCQITVTHIFFSTLDSHLGSHFQNQHHHRLLFFFVSILAIVFFVCFC